MKGFHRPGGAIALRALAVGTLLLSTSILALAQSGNPPDRVGRVAYIDGPVSYRPTAQDPWTQATTNIPMVAGTSIWTEPGSRAELEVGNARIRLDGGTEVDVLAVDYQNVQLNLPEGRVDVHLIGRRQDENYSVSTPRATVGLVADGDYREFAGDQDNPTRAATFYGEAQVASPTDTVNVDPGNEAILSGDPPVIEMGTAAKDDFDGWVDQREARLQARITARFVSPEVVGYQDLDNNGEWRQVPNYGAVWFPTNVQPGWEPYRYGHWRWVAPWGWTWVDDASWGFAPFHYGRWARIGDYWGWTPGQVVERPVYAPAMVAWVGDPGSITVGVGVGAAVGWLALGPGEVYRPWYHTDPDYVRQVNVAYVNRETINNINVTNITNIHNTYVNQRYATVVPQQTFVNARPVNAAALRVAPNAAVQVAAAPRQILPQATPAARFGTARPQAAAPKPAAFVAARQMQTTQRPAVPVAAPFTSRAVVHAAPAAAANFHQAPQGFQGVRAVPASAHPSAAPAAATPAAIPAVARPATAPIGAPGGFHPGVVSPAAPHPMPAAVPQKVQPAPIVHPVVGAPAVVPHPAAPVRPAMGVPQPTAPRFEAPHQEAPHPAAILTPRPAPAAAPAFHPAPIPHPPSETRPAAAPAAPVFHPAAAAPAAPRPAPTPVFHPASSPAPAPRPAPAPVFHPAAASVPRPMPAARPVPPPAPHPAPQPQGPHKDDKKPQH